MKERRGSTCKGKEMKEEVRKRIKKIEKMLNSIKIK